ncbi:hypothetical protein FRB98_000515 [Tulasnella sp. 332]|nr:hypothetical protein FRB98_000515 [Tulasnella sp. 332]
MTSSDTIPQKPAPWNLTGITSWTFLCSPLSPKVSFPSGWAATNEADALADGTFIGGPSCIMASMIRYGDSPAGQYDELLYIPGRWTDSSGKTGFRVTRIYVSNLISVENGRKNWNIPKYLANFDFTQEGKSIRVAVTIPGYQQPFFNAVLSPVPTLFGIPISTGILGQYMKASLSSMLQPPLPAGSPEKKGVVATTSHASSIPVFRGTTTLVTLKSNMHDGKLANGFDFPAVVPWRLGFQMSNGTTDLGVSEMYTVTH